MKNYFATICLSKLLFVVLLSFLPYYAFAESANFELSKYSKSYKPVDISMDGDEADIIELFSYDCSICYRAEALRKALVSNLPEGTKFKAYAVPTIRAEWHRSAQLFRAAEVNGLASRFHDVIFKYIHTSKIDFKSRSDIKDFLVINSLPDITADLNSHRADKLGQHIENLWIAANSGRVPTFIIKGKYLVFFDGDVRPDEFVKLVHVLYEDCHCAGLL